MAAITNARTWPELILGVIELIAVFSRQVQPDRRNLFGWVTATDLNYVGYAIVALFVVTRAVALSVWHFGRIEDKWTAGLRGAESTTN